MAEIEKNKYFLRNIFNISPGIDLTIGLSKYVKVKALISGERVNFWENVVFIEE